MYLDKNQDGSALLEVMITIMIVGIGLLGLAGMQARVIQMEQEAYQQAQAIALVNDMVDRINANRANATAYVSATPYGTGNTAIGVTNCTIIAFGVDRDRCEWSALLKGAAIADPGNPLGGIGNARGCVTEITAPTTCVPGVYQVDVVWQGKAPLFIPSVNCGANLYGRETLRRAVTARITVGTPTC